MSSQVSQPSAGQSPDFDVSRYICLVPVFREEDVDQYLIIFECIATTLKWPKHVWTLLLQCVLTGKAQKVYAALPSENSLDHEQVKAGILRAYELVPEAYRQKFCRFKRQESQAYVEFAREKEALFDRWCSAQGVKNFGGS